MASPSSCERGASLIGLLVVLVVLGATASIVVAALPTSPVTLPTSSTTAATGGHDTTTTSRTIVSAAILAECVADVQAVAGAAQTYATLNGARPPPGTTWATSSAKGGPFLESWPSAPGQFALRWTGATVVVAPAHGRSASGVGDAFPPTGCYAA